MELIVIPQRGSAEKASAVMWEGATGSGDRIPNGQCVSKLSPEPNPEHGLSARTSEPGRGGSGGKGKEGWEQ